MRKAIAELIQTLQPFDRLENEQIAQTLRWIESGAALFRIRKPDVPTPHLVSYFVLVDSQANKILLVDHKKSGLWLPAGGHVEIDEDPRQTVCREVQEELQIPADFLLADPLFLTVTETVGAVTKHVDVSLWFVLTGDSTRSLAFDEAEFYQIRWFAPDQLPLDRCDPHLQRFVEKLSSTQVLTKHH